MKGKLDIRSEIEFLNKEIVDIAKKRSDLDNHSTAYKIFQKTYIDLRNARDELTRELHKIYKAENDTKEYKGPNLVFFWENGHRYDTRLKKGIIPFMEMVMNFGMPDEYEIRS